MEIINPSFDRAGLKNMINKKTEDRKYHLDFEIIDLREQKRPEKMVKIARKNLKKVILHRINGKIGEC